MNDETKFGTKCKKKTFFNLFLWFHSYRAVTVHLYFRLFCLKTFYFRKPCHVHKPPPPIHAVEAWSIRNRTADKHKQNNAIALISDSGHWVITARSFSSVLSARNLLALRLVKPSSGAGQQRWVSVDDCGAPSVGLLTDVEAGSIRSHMVLCAVGGLAMESVESFELEISVTIKRIINLCRLFLYNWVY